MNRITDPLKVVDAVTAGSNAPGTQVLFRSESGTLTAFAFEAGQGLPEHVNPSDAVLLILEGAVDVSVAERELRLNQGDMVLLPAGEPHLLHPGEPFKMLLMLLRKHTARGDSA